MTIDFASLYEPVSVEQKEMLREQIRKNGIRHPILVTPAGTVVAGFTRKTICDEEGLDCPVQVIEGSDAELLVEAIADNPRRRLAPEQREQVEAVLSAEGWSNGRIGDVLGVSAETVRRDISPNEEMYSTTVVKRDGSSYRKATKDQLARRRAIVQELWEAGYTHNAIEAALDIGGSSMNGDLKALGITAKDPRRLRHDRLSSIEWRTGGDSPKRKRVKPIPVLTSAPTTPPLPAYRTSVVASSVERWVSSFNEGDFPNRLAHHVSDAKQANDAKWLVWTLTLLDAMRRQAEQLHRIVIDDAYREETRRGLDPALRTNRSDTPTRTSR